MRRNPAPTDRGPAGRPAPGPFRWVGIPEYQRARHLSSARAAATLRAVYALMFLAQTAVALAVAVVVRLLSAAPARPSGVLGAVLVALAVAELPLGVTLALLAGRASGRQAALSGAFLIAVVLSTPAWFLALALATGQRALPSLALLGVLALAYGLGVLLAGRLGRSAAAEVRPPPPTPRGDPG